MLVFKILHGLYRRWFYRPPTERPVPLAPRPDGTNLGSLSWTIRERGTEEVLATGSKVLCVDDLHVVEISHAGALFYNKTFGLAEPFVLILEEDPTPTGHEEVRLAVARADRDTFCWEWFTIEGAERAIKLQEPGQLGLRRARSKGCWELIETTFLTDVDFRVHAPGTNVGEEPDWRVTVHAGSTVVWPLGSGQWSVLHGGIDGHFAE